MIDYLYSKFHTYPNVGVACLYADYKDQTNQTLVYILGTFLRQLLTTVQEPIPDKVLQRLYDIRCQGGKVGIEDNLALLKMWLHRLKGAFICIDAIDELEPKVRWNLLNILRDLVTNNNNIRLFLTGRGHVESEVQKCFKVTQMHKVIITASQQDIQEFVRQQIKEDQDLNPDAMDEGLPRTL